MRVTIIANRLRECPRRKSEGSTSEDPMDRCWSLPRDVSRDPRSMDQHCRFPTTTEAAFDPKNSLVSFHLFKLIQMSVPSSPTHFAAQDDHAVLRSLSLPRTRTVAIVKNHALQHRLDIEPRISEAGFEVRELPTPTLR